MEVIKLHNIKIPSINQKYGITRARPGKPSRLFIVKEYKDFFNLLSNVCSKKLMAPPYIVKISIDNYGDIDNQIKVIVDSMQGNCIDNDRNVFRLEVIKNPIKRGKCGNISVSVETLNIDPQID